MSWRKESEFLLDLETAESENRYRFTFQTLSATDEGRFYQYRNNAVRLLQDYFGPSEKRTPEQHIDASAMLHVLTIHAAVLAALKSLEVLDDQQWVKAEWPCGWNDPATFALEAPSGLILPIFEAVVDAGNPAELFNFAGTAPDQKKVMKLSVK
jgi:hypothetical protein